MSRASLLFSLAVLAFVTLLVQAMSGFVMWLVLPRGGGDGGDRGFGGDGTGQTFIWNRHTWLDIHDWTGVALLVIIVVHVYMHWKWIYRQAKHYCHM